MMTPINKYKQLAHMLINTHITFCTSEISSLNLHKQVHTLPYGMLNTQSLQHKRNKYCIYNKCNY